MPQCPELPAKIARQRANVSSFAAFGGQNRVVSVGNFDQSKLMDRDRAGGDFNGFTVPGQIVGTLATKFHGGEARRHLLDRAGKARQQPFDRVPIGTLVAGRYDSTFGVVGVAFFTPTDGAAISLS